MRNARSSTQVRRRGDAYVVSFSRVDVFDFDCLHDVRRLIEQLSRDEPGLKVVLDLGDVVLLSSTAIGMIVAMHNVLRPRGGRLRLANLSPETDAMFELTRLRDVVEVYETIEEAISPQPESDDVKSEREAARRRASPPSFGSQASG